MSVAAGAKLVAWLDEWPTSVVLGEGCVKLAEEARANAVVLESTGEARSIPAEAARIRAEYDACRRASRPLALRLGAARLRLGTTAGHVQRGRVELELTLPGAVEEDLGLDLMITLGVKYGAVRRGAVASGAFRLAGLTAVGSPAGEHVRRGPFEWWSDIPADDVERWLRSVGRHMVTGAHVGGNSAAWGGSSGRVGGRAEQVTSPPEVPGTPPFATPSYLIDSSASHPSRAVQTEPEDAQRQQGGPRVDPQSGVRTRGEAPVVSTEAIDLTKLREALARASVPFAGATSPERLAELRQAAQGADLTALPVAPESGDDGDSTMMLPTSALVGQLAAPPFAASLASTAFPDLAVDRYAALSAELEARGPTPEVLRRYDIPTAAALRALHEEQARRFARDPAMRARFDERRAHFLGFMRPRPA